LILMKHGYIINQIAHQDHRSIKFINLKQNENTLVTIA
jgi:hypothetical protein